MEKTMKKIIFIAVLTVLLSGCSAGPSDSDLKQALQTKMRAEVQQQLDQIKALGGLGGGSNSFVEKMRGSIPNPEDIFITSLSSEDAQEKENGDYVAKVSMTVKSPNGEEKSAMRLTMTEVDGEWLITGVQPL